MFICSLLLRPVSDMQYSCPFTFLNCAAVIHTTVSALLYIVSHMIACSVTLDSSVLLYLSDAGSLRERGQLTVEQLSINRSSTGQVSHRAMCDL